MSPLSVVELHNESTGEWTKVRETCPQPHWEYSRGEQMYAVHVCDFFPGLPEENQTGCPSKMRLFFHPAPLGMWTSRSPFLTLAAAGLTPPTLPTQRQ